MHDLLMQVFMMTPRSYKCCGQFVSVVRLPAKDFSDWRFVAAVAVAAAVVAAAVAVVEGFL